MYSPLDFLSLPAFFATSVAIVLLSIEVGFRLGRRRRRATEEEREAPVGAIVAAILGLLGFVLAFTYSIAASRFDARRTIIVDEANAIGTTYLRAGFLEDDRPARVRTLLKEYVAERLRAAETGDADRLLHRSGDLHHALWGEAEAAAKAAPNSFPVALFIQALNETIDIHSSRVLVSLQSRIPIVLWETIFVVTILTMLGVGYFAGLTRSRRSPAIIVLALTFSTLLYLVADLDRPREGMIRTSQSAMLDLQHMMETLP